MKARDSMKIKGKLRIQLFDRNGNVKVDETIENNITNQGFDYVLECLANNSQNQVKTIAVGWGVGSDTAFNGTQTDLQGAGKNRKTGVVTYTHGSKQYSVVGTWGVNEPDGSNPVGIFEYGMFKALTGTVMFSRIVRSLVLNKLATDTLILTWTFSVA